MVDIKHYAYRVLWSEEDQEFVGLCTEFHSLSFFAETQQDALSGVTSLIDEVVKDMLESGEEIPVPIADRKFSGKVSLRLGVDIHRRAVMAAADAKQGLNAFVADKLALSC